MPKGKTATDLLNSMQKPALFGATPGFFSEQAGIVPDTWYEGPWEANVEIPENGRAGVDLCGVCGRDGCCNFCWNTRVPCCGSFSFGRCFRGCRSCVVLDFVFNGHESRALAVAVCFHFVFMQLLDIVADQGLFCREAIGHLPLTTFHLQTAAFFALIVQATSNSLWAHPRLLWSGVGLLFAYLGVREWIRIEASYCYGGPLVMKKHPVQVTLGTLTLCSWLAVGLLTLTAAVRTLVMALDDSCMGRTGLLASRRYHAAVAGERLRSWRRGYVPTLCCDCNCGCPGGDAITEGPREREDEDKNKSGSGGPRVPADVGSCLSINSEGGSMDIPSGLVNVSVPMSCWERTVTVVDSEGWRCARPGPLDRCLPARLGVAVGATIFAAVLLGVLPLVYEFAIMEGLNKRLEQIADAVASQFLPVGMDDSGSMMGQTGYDNDAGSGDGGGGNDVLLQLVHMAILELQGINRGLATSLSVGGIMGMVVGIGLQVWACMRWADAVRGLLLRGYCDESHKAVLKERNALELGHYRAERVPGGSAGQGGCYSEGSSHRVHGTMKERPGASAAIPAPVPGPRPPSSVSVVGHDAKSAASQESGDPPREHSEVDLEMGPRTNMQDPHELNRAHRVAAAGVVAEAAASEERAASLRQRQGPGDDRASGPGSEVGVGRLARGLADDNDDDDQVDSEGFWAAIQPWCKGAGDCVLGAGQGVLGSCGAGCYRCLWGCCCCFVCCRLLLPPVDEDYVSWGKADEASRTWVRWRGKVLEGRASIQQMTREEDQGDGGDDGEVRVRSWLGTEEERRARLLVGQYYDLEEDADTVQDAVGAGAGGGKGSTGGAAARAAESDSHVTFVVPRAWDRDHLLLLCGCCCCVDYARRDCVELGCTCVDRPRNSEGAMTREHAEIGSRKQVLEAAGRMGQHALPWESSSGECSGGQVSGTAGRSWMPLLSGSSKAKQRRENGKGSVDGGTKEGAARPDVGVDVEVAVKRVVLPSGLLGDVPLDAYDYHLATSLVSAHVASNLIAMGAVMIVVAALVFPFVYVRTRASTFRWLFGVIVVGVTNWIVRKCIFRAWLVMPLRLRNTRAFLLLEGMYSITAGVLAGLVSGCLRMAQVVMWRIIYSARLDVPQLPGPLRTADGGFSAYAAAMRLRMYRNVHLLDHGLG